MSYSLSVTKLAECEDSSLHEVVRVRATLRLCEHIIDTNTLEHSTHSATSYKTSTLSGWLEENLSTTERNFDLVWDSTLENRNLNEVLLSRLNALSDGSCNLTGLSETPSDYTITVTYNDNSSECEGATTFCYLCNAVDGTIGWGLGKAGEVQQAIAKATDAAKKNLVKVPVLKGTIPHEMEVSFGGAKVFLKPAAAGTGMVCGGAMRAVLESVGVKDVLAKSKGSSNPHNLVKATIKALSMMRDAYTIAGTRGISMEKVFRG